MKKDKKVIVSILIVIEVISIFLTYKSFTNKEIDKILENNEIHKKQFAIYITENGIDEEYKGEGFPVGYTLNEGRSYCVDNNGKRVDSEGNKVFRANSDGSITVTSSITLFCTFYFVDNDAPEVEISDPTPTKIKNGETAIYTLTISEEVTKVENIEPRLSGENAGTVALSSGSGTNWIVTVIGGTGNTDTTLTIPAGMFKDKAGNPNIEVTKTGLTISNSAGDIVFAESSKGTNGLNLSPLGGMYRFQGTKETNEVNNYICFGTTNPDTCKDYPDTYMYRIIGVVAEGDDNLGIEAGDIKVIKKTKVGDPEWYNSYTENASQSISWDKSYIFQKLNGLDSSSNLFIGVDAASPLSYMNESNWYNLIRDVSWYQGDLGYEYANIKAEAMYKIETGKTKEGTSDGIATWINTSGGTSTGPWTPITILGTYATARTVNGKTIQTAKIGLMSLHDYYWSSTVTDNCNNTNETYTNCLNGWMHIANNGRSENERTMSRTGRLSYDNNRYYAWYVHTNGYVSNYNLVGTFALRPVFYLKSTTNISYNTNDNENTPGSAGNPYVITLPTS